MSLLKRTNMKQIICAVGILLAAFTVSAIDPDISKEDFISLAYSSLKTDSITFCTFEDVRFIQYNDEEGNPVFFIISFDFCRRVGYEGFTNVGISLDNTGKVLSVKILSSEDTPSFVKRVRRKWFLNQFTGYSENKKIKIITGATKTCKAVEISIEESVAKFLPIIKEFIKKDKKNGAKNEKHRIKNSFINFRIFRSHLYDIGFYQQGRKNPISFCRFIFVGFRNFHIHKITANK